MPRLEPSPPPAGPAAAGVAAGVWGGFGLGPAAANGLGAFYDKVRTPVAVSRMP